MMTWKKISDHVDLTAGENRCYTRHQLVLSGRPYDLFLMFPAVEEFVALEMPISLWILANFEEKRLIY